MKKFFLFTIMAFVCIGMNAQIMKIMKDDVVVATYTSEQANKVVFEDDNNTDVDNDDENSILGTWYYTPDDYVLESGEYYKEQEYGEFTFLKDGTGIRYEKDVEEGKEKTYYFAWKTDGDLLYTGWADTKEEIIPIVISDRDTWGEICKYSISGNKMKFIYNYERPESKWAVRTVTRK